ncbi:unnamed protein product [Pedinophyceae sp. YPF-701]|nr:unnamed protein product [Pedinophyceae sp. YPF-701]
MSAQYSLKDRMDALSARFKEFFSPKPQYAQVSTIDEPLMTSSDAQDNTDAVSYEATPTRTAAPRARDPYGRAVANDLRDAQLDVGQQMPSQAEEARELRKLGMDAAELLWDIVSGADGKLSNLTEDVLATANQLILQCKDVEARLRGVISDFVEDDESALAGGLEALDALQNVQSEFEELRKGGSPQPGAWKDAPAQPQDEGGLLDLGAVPNTPAEVSTPQPGPAQQQEREEEKKPVDPVGDLLDLS